MKSLITGATGFVGSHIAKKLKDSGHEVIALARRSSDTRFLEEMGIPVRYGSVTDISTVYQAAEGVDMVFHAAALTEEWIPKKLTYEVNVGGTENILQASIENNVGRFFFISSLAVLGCRNHYNTPVDAEYLKAGDPYIDSKIDAEKLVRKFADFGLAVTILRPGFMYGPYDRRFMKRVLEKLKGGSFKFVGDGKNKLNLNYVGNFADAVVLASQTENSIGKIYNIANDDKTLDMRTFTYKVADLWGFDRPKGHVPVEVARIATSIMESSARLIGKKEPPILTKTRLKFLTLNLEFDISAAKQDLGFENKVKIDQGLCLTKKWIEEANAYETLS